MFKTTVQEKSFTEQMLVGIDYAPSIVLGLRL